MQEKTANNKTFPTREEKAKNACTARNVMERGVLERRRNWIENRKQSCISKHFESISWRKQQHSSFFFFKKKKNQNGQPFLSTSGCLLHVSYGTLAVHLPVKQADQQCKAKQHEQQIKEKTL